ncbi:MAG: DUF3107 family protein [Acidobacteria bacterium]|nr:DUF3107 family protein [Acidobacteriota bacterium]
MADTTKIRIGIASARELEVEVADADAVVKQLEQAMEAGEGVVWVEDTTGHKHAISGSSIAFLEIRSEKTSGGVGFGS